MGAMNLFALLAAHWSALAMLSWRKDGILCAFHSSDTLLEIQVWMASLEQHSSSLKIMKH